MSPVTSQMMWNCSPAQTVRSFSAQKSVTHDWVGHFLVTVKGLARMSVTRGGNGKGQGCREPRLDW